MKKSVFSLIIVFILIFVPTLNFINVSKNKVSANSDAENDIDVSQILSTVSVDEAQAAIDKTEKKKAEQQAKADIKKEIEKSIKLIDEGKKTYRQVFKDVYIVGDSLMNGLEVYSILNSNHLITQVSASLSHLEENLDKIISLRPPVLILHYGINMISDQDARAESFINRYTTLIKKIKKSSSKTRIIVSLLFPVDRSRATAPRFAAVGKYNKLLKKMCNELKIEYLDSTSVLKAHPEYYAKDGIHQSKAFYEKYWLKFIMREKEIY